ncbi:hypothetical protein [Endozoicomonas acroporae]|uniref:hypothetical protein n=1 Tax=Endozoicomonas acroporae TaxID=1701104 RepID=UPI003D7AB214
MRKWVPYDKSKGKLIHEVDQVRLKRVALQLAKELEVCNKQNTNRVAELLGDKIIRSISGKITKPESVPALQNFTESLEYPDSLIDAICHFIAAISGHTVIQHIVGVNYFYENEVEFLKMENGQWLIFEEFED